MGRFEAAHAVSKARCASAGNTELSEESARAARPQDIGSDDQRLRGAYEPGRALAMDRPTSLISVLSPDAHAAAWGQYRRRERHGSPLGRSFIARAAGRISECPLDETDESEIGFPKISRGPAKAGPLSVVATISRWMCPIVRLVLSTSRSVVVHVVRCTACTAASYGVSPNPPSDRLESARTARRGQELDVDAELA